MGTPIANTEFVLSATNRRGDYAKKASRGRLEYAPAVLQFAWFRRRRTRSFLMTRKSPPTRLVRSFLRFGSLDLGYGAGAGGRFTYNLNKYIAFDSEVDFFLPDEGPPYATQGLFGIQGRDTIKRLGIFAKQGRAFKPTLLSTDEQARFALDVGAVAEVYPYRNLVLRVDASDVIIPFGNNVVGQGLFAQRLGTTHNFQFTLGVGVRF